MFRSRSWFGSGLWKPKNPHSLEQLKHLYNVLSKNQVVSDSNRSLLVETLRAITEILIWGDQNDSTVFDFFLEKNMLSFFLKIMKQKCGSYVCVQLLQTLNILFENIRNETSLYYLLSNNHVNSIIVHKFDFSDEEVMAYYISFLKTLSLKLNSHTIHFFYNEHTNDFPLYTEAIKFFNNSESMVRIAVRTLTLNVYRVQDDSMLSFIRDKTAAPYFTNLVWFIGNHVLELNSCLRENSQFEAQSRLADLVAEHLDHLHYINDILLLEIDDLNKVLTDHLVLHLLVPLYVGSLCPLASVENVSSAKVSRVLALFLLSQVFLILTHPPLVRKLAGIIFNGNEELLKLSDAKTQPQHTSHVDNDQGHLPYSSRGSSASCVTNTEIPAEEADAVQQDISDSDASNSLLARPVLNSIMGSLIAKENDYSALFALCLLHATHDNIGLKSTGDFDLSSYNENGEKTIEQTGSAVGAPDDFSWVPPALAEDLLNLLVSIVSDAVGIDGRIRIVTLNLVKTLLTKVVTIQTGSTLIDELHLSAILKAHAENVNVLQHYYKTDELFLENFEAEYEDFQDSQKISVESLLMDSQLLLPPVVSPLSGISFDKRLPCGEVEKSRRAIKVYFVLRSLLLLLKGESENLLPLAKPENIIKVEDNLDLSNSDIQSCIIVQKDNTKLRRFLVIDVFQFILVEPSNKKMGWGVVKFVGWLQDVEVLGDKDDPRCLHITVKNSAPRKNCATRLPLLSSKFIFDDHIRCMAAKQRLLKAKLRARHRKLHAIAKLLNCVSTSLSPEDSRRQQGRTSARNDRTLYNPIGKTLPGLAMAVVQTSDKGNVNGKKNKIQQTGKEEIPLESIERRGESPIEELHRHSRGLLQSRPAQLTVRSASAGSSMTSQANVSQIKQYYCTPDSTTTPQSETSFVADPSVHASAIPETQSSNTNPLEDQYGCESVKDVKRTVQIV